MDELKYKEYILKINKAYSLRDEVFSLINSEHPGYNLHQCIIYAKLHNLITEDEWELLKVFCI